MPRARKSLTGYSSAAFRLTSLLALSLLASCTHGVASPPTGGQTPTVSSSPSESPSPSPSSGVHPLGDITVPSSPPCRRGSCSVPFRVTCPDVERAARGNFVIYPTRRSARGMVVVTLGGFGT